MKHLCLFLSMVAVLLSSCSQPNIYLQTAESIAQSEMKHHPEMWTCDGASRPKWEYTPTLMARAFLELYARTGDTAYLNHVQRFADLFIAEDGSILTYKKSLYNMDRIQGGNFLIMLHAINPQPQYTIAIETLRNQLREQPRTSEGGFWHKQVYPNQMWLDGLFTGTSFYARYADYKPEPEAWSDIVNQFLIVDAHTRKANGLNYHGWDESRQMGWSDPVTGCSPETWGRAEGWYVMALCDVLELMPASQPERPALEAILRRVIDALLAVQDPQTHLWYQVPDRAGEEGNYLESTCSAMYCFGCASMRMAPFRSSIAVRWQVWAVTHIGMAPILTMSTSVSVTMIPKVSPPSSSPPSNSRRYNNSKASSVLLLNPQHQEIVVYLIVFLSVLIDIFSYPTISL